MRACSAASRVRKAGVSSTRCPPTSSWLCIAAMRPCSAAMAALWRAISADWRSSAAMAASLSACSRRRASSTSSTSRLSTRSSERCASSARSRRSSRSYLRSSARWSRSSLTVGALRTRLARAANLRVDSDSGKASAAGDTMAMKVVRQLPPSESSRMRVSLESR